VEPHDRRDDRPESPNAHQLDELEDLDELTTLVESTGDLYVRWSRGPEADRCATSVDQLTGVELPGLSANLLMSSRGGVTDPLECGSIAGCTTIDIWAISQVSCRGCSRVRKWRGGRTMSPSSDAFVRSQDWQNASCVSPRLLWSGSAAHGARSPARSTNRRQTPTASALTPQRNDDDTRVTESAAPRSHPSWGIAGKRALAATVCLSLVG
jgi:hypothetical protein